MRRISFLLISLLLLIVAPPVSAGDTSLWHVRLDMHRLGPVELHLQIERDGEVLSGKSLSGAVAILQELDGGHDLSNGLVAFTASRDAGGAYHGTIVSPGKDGEIQLQFDGDALSGNIDGGILAGSIVGEKVAAATAIRDYEKVLESFDAVVAAKLFSPGDLQQAAYQEFRAKLGRIAAVATDDLDLLLGFSWLWHNDPFSHLEFKRSQQSAAELFAFFDSYRVGFEAATVEFVDGIAILTVRTMMGADTIEQIEAAFDRIATEKPAALIIDLRGNGGGAFAVKPLVEHVIDEPVDAGFFISQVWNRKHDELPSTEIVLTTPAWDGWSIIGFWEAVQESDIVRLQFNPAEPNFDGPVYVLLDERSASATELAADAFRTSGIATLVGQRSAGEMLSQSMFDVDDGFIVSLPVADYYSVVHGRIEGTGVPVDIAVEPENALAVATQLAREAAH